MSTDGKTTVQMYQEALDENAALTERVKVLEGALEGLLAATTDSAKAGFVSADNSYRIALSRATDKARAALSKEGK